MSMNVAGSAASIRCPGGPAGQWNTSPAATTSTSCSHSMVMLPEMTRPQWGASHQSER